MNCNTWGVISLILSAALAYVSTQDIGITSEITTGASVGMLVAAIAFFVIRRVSPFMTTEEH